jgi:uncharacterized protein
MSSMTDPRASSEDGDGCLEDEGCLKEVAVSLASVVLICACASSPPVRYLVLDPVGLQGEVWQRSGDPVHVTSVRLPATLDRREVVRQEAPNVLTVSKEYRWAAPLQDMAQRVLSQDLAARLTPGKVILPGQPAPAGTSAISVEVLEFGVAAGGSIVLDGSWSIVPGGSEIPAASYRFQLHQPATGRDFAAQAQAMSVLVGRLADSIAGTLGVRKPD